MLSQIGTTHRKALGWKRPEESKDGEIKVTGYVLLRHGGRIAYPTGDMSIEMQGEMGGGEEGVEKFRGGKRGQATYSCALESASRTVLIHASDSARTSCRARLPCSESRERGRPSLA